MSDEKFEAALDKELERFDWPHSDTYDRGARWAREFTRNEMQDQVNEVGSHWERDHRQLKHELEALKADRDEWKRLWESLHADMNRRGPFKMAAKYEAKLIALTEIAERMAEGLRDVEFDKIDDGSVYIREYSVNAGLLYNSVQALEAYEKFKSGGDK